MTTQRPGDTGVGYTLETLLGIPANSSTAPDFKGIEIKAFRQRKQKKRATVFTKVPDWNLSRIKSATELLFERGKYNEERGKTRLVQTLSAVKPNSFDLLLDLDHDNSFLHQIYVGAGAKVRDVTWKLDVLKASLSEKHRESFWVTALTKGRSGDRDESFLYSSVKHTGNVDPAMLPTLIETGVVTVDYTMKETRSGKQENAGFSFRMSPDDVDLIFSSVKFYDLN